MTKKNNRLDFIEGEFRSPVGVTAFVTLDKPREAFGDTVYEVTVSWDASDPKFQKFRDAVVAEEKKYVLSKGKKFTESRLFKPFRNWNKETKTSTEDDSRLQIRFKLRPQSDGSLPKYFGGAVDANGDAVQLSKFGDEVRVGFTLAGYSAGLGTGVTPYLKSILVVKKNATSKKQAAEWWDTDEGEQDNEEIPKVGTKQKSKEDDDLPF